ncbi:Phosphate ABC transporter, periplasmic phosphate-binding protein PstS (TC 3.A.1.7.1) [hydrothermal vent metagenome]|uniref:Phosphate ABC transporter, periplasmic phosphate-binding protein PstS (TC 3.A.1.7.1) n=1 Tax=hydrothermal vent metagenome TaxID=652676 RepID=A0A3B1D597_9ZZZZ
MKKTQLGGAVLVTVLILFSLMGSSFAETLKGTIRIDGSSTVFPITEAVAEEFGKKYRRVRVTVAVSGTGGGFKKFSIGETDINDASRPIKSSEKKLAQKNGTQYIQLPVAFDGISVVVNPKNTWLDYLTVAELKMIWEPGSQVTTWKDIRADWPDRKIRLYGPGTDSGTFDYFTGAINGKSHASRSDFTKSEDDNVLVQGVAGDRDALGYFGFAYYTGNKDKLKIVPIKNKSEPVAPSLTTINDGSYAPLSRPIFIYVSEKAVQRPEVAEFVEFYLKNAAVLSREVGYVPLPKSQYDEGLDKLKKALVKDVL